MLKLNGKPLELRETPPTVVKLAAFLSKSPADEVFTIQTLCAKVSAPARTVRENQRHKLLAPHSLLVGRIRYWGSVKAIAELRRMADEAQ